MGSLLGGMQQGAGAGAQSMVGPSQAQGGTGMTGASTLGGGLSALLTTLLMGPQQGGLLSMLLNPGQGLLGGQGQSTLPTGGGQSPQAQGFQGDNGGLLAGMNPGNYMGQTMTGPSTIDRLYSPGPSVIDYNGGP